MEPERARVRPRDMRPLVVAVLATLTLLALAGLALGGSLRAPVTAPPPASDLPGIPSDRATVPAPIDRVDVQIRESLPPQVSLHISAGLPSGCAQRHSHQVERDGTTVKVTVLNSMPKGNPICTMIYGTYDLDIDLGTGFTAGTTYTVRVNDQEKTFRL